MSAKKDMKLLALLPLLSQNIYSILIYFVKVLNNETDAHAKHTFYK